MDRKLIDTPEVFALIADTHGGPPMLTVGVDTTATGFERSHRYNIYHDDPLSPLEGVRTDFGDEVALRIARAALLSCITHPDNDDPRAR